MNQLEQKPLENEEGFDALLLKAVPLFMMLMMMTTTTKTAGPYTPTKQDIQRIDKRTD
jgi:hypothetical protein